MTVKAGDHDFGGDHVTPFGILDLTHDHVELIVTNSKVTADFMVDYIELYWFKNADRDGGKDTLLLNADNGPENSSRRTQFMLRQDKSGKGECLWAETFRRNLAGRK